MTLTFEAVKRWVMEQFHSKREHISVTRGTSDAYRPVIVGSDGKLDGSLLDRADIFSDAEGDPANVGTAADGASTYAARRNHVHDVAADYVDNTRLRNSGALSVIGRSANSTGDPADISATAATDAVLRESGSVLGFGTIATAGIAANAISNAKLAQMAQSTIKGRAAAAGTGDPTDLTAAQVATILTTSGTWTPALTFGGGSTGITYTTRVGRYLRIGDIVIATAYVLLSSKGSSTGAAVITGLPVASANVANAYHTVPIYFNAMNSMSGALLPYLSPNSTSVNLRQLNTGSGTDLTDTNFNNSSDFIITATYLAA